MRAIIDRIKNETAFVGSLILVAVEGLWQFEVITLTDDQFGWIIMALTVVFGATVRQSVYSKSTVRNLEAEYLDQ